MTSSALASISHIRKSFLSEPVLNDISFDINEKEIVTLIGPNGSGKTTLVRVILGILQADSGKVWRKAKLQMSYVPQKVHIDPSLPINVDFFLHHSKKKCNPAHFDNIVNELKITKLLKRPMQNISGGELQKVLLAKALLSKPQLLILDEPAQGVDITGQEELYQLIARIRDQYHCAVLMVSHDLHLVMASTDKVICLNHHICCSGAPAQVSQHPEYLKLFGNLTHSELALYTHKHDHQHDDHGNIVKDHQHG